MAVSDSADFALKKDFSVKVESGLTQIEDIEVEMNVTLLEINLKVPNKKRKKSFFFA